MAQAQDVWNRFIAAGHSGPVFGKQALSFGDIDVTGNLAQVSVPRALQRALKECTVSNLGICLRAIVPLSLGVSCSIPIAGKSAMAPSPARGLVGSRMKTIQITIAALTLATVALTSTGCMSSRGERISEPSGASAVYRNNEWQAIDTSNYREVPNHQGGYYDASGSFHPRNTRQDQ